MIVEQITDLNVTVTMSHLQAFALMKLLHLVDQEISDIVTDMLFDSNLGIHPQDTFTLLDNVRTAIHGVRYHLDETYEEPEGCPGCDECTPDGDSQKTKPAPKLVN